MMLQASTTMQQQFVLNYPLIFIVMVVVIVLLYRFMKRRQVESTMDESWLGNEPENNQ